MVLNVCRYTSQGGRSYNEDCVKFKYSKNGAVFVVADGLGGHNLGELASAKACDVLLDSWPGESGMTGSDWLKDSISKANTEVMKLQTEHNVVMKSTVVALSIVERNAAWANVGDSRLYFYRNKKLRALTNDHSVAYKKYKAGEITRNDLRTDEDQSLLLRSLGSEDRSAPELYNEVKIKAGDAFLLCSDGFWEYISEKEMMDILAQSDNSKTWAKKMLKLVKSRVNGKNDNLSLLTINVLK